jgi:hypothetical protein
LANSCGVGPGACAESATGAEVKTRASAIALVGREKRRKVTWQSSVEQFDAKTLVLG